MRAVRRRISVVAATVAAALGVAAGPAHAGPIEDVIVNGILSVTPLCQGKTESLIIQCTELERLTQGLPLMLAFNPVTTHIVVLGAGLTPEGKIQPVLEERLRAALRTAATFETAPIVVTGGVPRNGVTEAAAMREWLIEHGIAPERIIEEPRSRSTVENARFTNKLLIERGATGAVLVTNEDHLTRAMINFRQAVDARIPVVGIVAK